VATAVSAPTTPAPRFDDRRAARVEDLVGRLVAQGAPEAAVRELVGEAVKLGQDRPSGREIPHIGPPDADY